MNMLQALNKGYKFSGIYSKNKEEVKLRAKEEREKGLRACVITKIYKGRIYNTTGYSVYVKDKQK